MKISGVSSFQNGSKNSFGSVIRTDDNDFTQGVYSWLRKQSGKNSDIIKRSHFGEVDSKDSFLLLIDDEAGKEASDYIALEQSYNNKFENLYKKPVEALEQMLPKKTIRQFKKETESPLSANRSRGETYLQKIYLAIESNLENERVDKVKNLYNKCLEKSKTISTDEIYKTVLKLFKG